MGRDETGFGLSRIFKPGQICGPYTDIIEDWRQLHHAALLDKKALADAVLSLHEHCCAVLDVMAPGMPADLRRYAIATGKGRVQRKDGGYEVGEEMSGYNTDNMVEFAIQFLRFADREPEAVKL